MKRFAAISAALLVFLASTATAQDIPADYQQVLTTLGKQGDYKANVLKVNIPRNDISVTVANVKTPTPFGFGGWIAMTKGTGGMDVMMGDLVLTQNEVNPVMTALLDNGFDVTALHNHFFCTSAAARGSSTCSRIAKQTASHGSRTSRRQPGPERPSSFRI